MRTMPYFTDRDEAGRRLGEALPSHVRLQRPLIVLGLPRGGVIVAAHVATALDAPLDICAVRKLGVPGHEELAFGAIASGGARVLNAHVIAQLGITQAAIDAAIAREEQVLERREAMYRGRRVFPTLAGRTVIVVDDGAATGASMRVAVMALRALGPRSIIVALPVASHDAVALLREAADECVALVEPEPFHGVGAWYHDFSEVSDGDVRSALTDAGQTQAQR